MFRKELNAFREAERRIRIHATTGGFIITVDDDTHLTAPTTDPVLIRHWHRIITVQAAVLLLGRQPSPTAGMLSTNTYSAFAYEVERNHA